MFYTPKNHKAAPSLTVNFLVKMLITALLMVPSLNILKRKLLIYFIKKIVKLENLTLGQSASFRISQKYMRESCTNPLSANPTNLFEYV